MRSVSKSPQPEKTRHRPVMVREALRALALAPGLTVVDGTVGAGGHAAEMISRISPGGRLIGLDRDPMMLRLASRRLGDGEETILRQASYADLRNVLDALSIRRVDRVLLDLGLSSDQLADESRGFGFQADGPLDLRFDSSTGISAGEFLASRSVDEIEEVFKTYGEEPRAGAIAREVKASGRRLATLTGRELAEIAARAAPAGRRGTHPATRVFQALRIAVNGELEELRQMLDDVLADCLSPGGRVAVITFHSLEDRMVKQAVGRTECWIDVGRSISPTPSEVRVNPRARSARIRYATLRPEESRPEEPGPERSQPAK